MRRARKIGWIRTGLAAAVLIALPTAGLCSVESLRVGHASMSFGSLQLNVPEGWTFQLGDASGVPAYTFTPPGGPEFVLLVTPIPDVGRSLEDRCAWARSVAANSRDDAMSVAVESEVSVQEQRGERTCLLFFSVTDKTVTNPTTEDFKYMIQGAAGVGHLLATFTILTNIESPRERGPALEMLRTAEHVGGPADPLAPAAAATRLAYPDKDWGLMVDFGGMELEAPQAYRDNEGIRFAGSSEEPGLMVTIFFEPTDRGSDPKTYRGQYRKKVLGRKKMGGVRVRRENIRESERGGMALLRYTNVSGKLRQQGMNAFLVRDGLWIDIHLSTTRDESEADRLFDSFLGPVRFVE